MAKCNHHWRDAGIQGGWQRWICSLCGAHKSEPIRKN